MIFTTGVVYNRYSVCLPRFLMHFVQRSGPVFDVDNLYRRFVKSSSGSLLRLR